MGIADTLIGVQQNTNQSLKADPNALTNGLEQGAKLALQAQTLQENKVKLQQKSQEVQSAKLDTFVSAVQKGGSLKGAARSNYYNKVMPSYRDALGLTDTFSNESLSFITSSPETLSRADTVVADVRSGKITEQQGIALLNDPVGLMGVRPTYEEAEALREEVGKAGESALARTATERNARIVSEGQNQRTYSTQQAAFEKQQRDLDNAAQEKANTKIGEEFATWTAVGGSSTMKANTAALNKLADDIEKIPDAKLSNAVPGLNSKIAQDVLNPRISAIRNQAEAIGVTNLKATFGGNPTEGEREALLNTLFPIRLGNKEIAKRLRQEAAKTTQTIKDKEAAFRGTGLLGAESVTSKTGEKTPIKREAPPKTFNVYGAQMTKEQADAFFKANPKLQKPTGL